jgi:hypothetical protein
MRPILVCHHCEGIYLPPAELYYPAARVWASLTECAGCMPAGGGPANPDTAGLHWPSPAPRKAPVEPRAGRRPRRRNTRAGGDPSGARTRY